MSVETMEAPSVSAPEVSIGAQTSIVSEISLSTGPELSQAIPAPLDNFSFDTPIINETRNPFPEISYPTISVEEITRSPSIVIDPEPNTFPRMPEPWGSVNIETLEIEPDFTVNVSDLIEKSIIEESANDLELKTPEVPRSAQFELTAHQPVLEEIASRITSQEQPQVQVEIEQVIADIKPNLRPIAQTAIPNEDLDDSIVDILTLSSQTENQANLAQLQKALAQTQELGFTQKEQDLWKEKLTKAAAQAIVQTEAEIKTDTLIETQTELDVEIISDAAPPDDIDNTTNSNENEQDGPEQEEPVAPQEPLWDIHRVDQEWEVAEPSLKKRQRLAQESVDNSFIQMQMNHKEALQGELLKLDIPDIEESLMIAKHNLKYPQIAADAQLAVEFTESDDPQVLAGVVQTVVENKPPEEKHPVPVHIATVKHSELDPEPKALADDGAEHIIFKNVWKPVKRTYRREIWELDKQKAA